LDDAADVPDRSERSSTLQEASGAAPTSEAGDECNYGNDQECKEQNLSDSSSRAGNASEAEESCDKRNDKENECPT